MTTWLGVWVNVPNYSGLSNVLTYSHPEPLVPGTLVRVPIGQRLATGIVVETQTAVPEHLDTGHLKSIAGVLSGLPPLPADWLNLARFTARYYQRAEGEVALNALPASLKGLDDRQLARRLKKIVPIDAWSAQADLGPQPHLTQEQVAAVEAIQNSTQPILLFGPTGSGKTEVYLRAAQACLIADPTAQILVLVPEINLTPQLIRQFEARFGAQHVCAMHSGLTPALRLHHWLRAHLGHCRILLGTRMAIFASLPQLQLIIVDEEHDASYKSQEGARFSARDLAVFRAHQSKRLHPCTVVLGSATPSLETWNAALLGRYQKVALTQRIGGASLPRLRMVDMQRQPKGTVIAAPLLEAIQQRALKGEQSLLLLNRRGFAPVLSCGSCGWKSQCPNCSVFQVFHKRDRTLRCHHCGFVQRVPHACPDCGEVDIEPIGKGTEQVQEHLVHALESCLTPSGHPLRVGRLDADTAPNAQALETQLAAMHAGEVDVLVGTQMIAKGHDFRRITLVAAINPDGALYASDFRAPERLFALLMQAGGRAGRDRELSRHGEMWIQTWIPEHPLFEALANHDFAGFAQRQLQERESAQLPPFVHHALVRAEAKTQEIAQGFLNDAAQAVATEAIALGITSYPAIPMTTARVANVERAQWLLEAPARPALLQLLAQVQFALQTSASRRRINRWAIDVDPLSI